MEYAIIARIHHLQRSTRVALARVLSPTSVAGADLRVDDAAGKFSVFFKGRVTLLVGINVEWHFQQVVRPFSAKVDETPPSGNGLGHIDVGLLPQASRTNEFGESGYSGFCFLYYMTVVQKVT